MRPCLGLLKAIKAKTDASIAKRAPAPVNSGTVLLVEWLLVLEDAALEEEVGVVEVVLEEAVEVVVVEVAGAEFQ